MWFTRLFFVFLLIGSIVNPMVSVANHHQDILTKDWIESLQNKIKKVPAMPSKLAIVSGAFLGKPYVLGALGEGSSGEYDQFPLYRLDAFDCLTFVETVLALSLTDNFANFRHKIEQIRYQNGKVSFIKRNHFTDLDWNPNNQHSGILKEITPSIHDPKGKPIFKMAVALINKPSWYEYFTQKNIRLINGTPKQVESRLQTLKNIGQQLPVKTAKIPYLPLNVLFDAKKNPQMYLFKQIPNGAVIEIVRPNWDLTKEIGTHLNVSHLGFAFWKNDQLMFRNASTRLGKVVDQPLIDYLKQALNSPTIKGINVQTVCY